MISISDIRFSEIQRIQELWERNLQYHIGLSPEFSEDYRSFRFDERMKPLATLSENQLKISVAQDDGELCGYCISTIHGGCGELMSLHVLESKRGKGIGRLLTSSHLQWLSEQKCGSIQVQVDCSNAPSIGFYESLGFRSSIVTMQLNGTGLNRP